MDTSVVHSKESISPAGKLVEVHDAHGAGCSTKNPSEFVNHDHVSNSVMHYLKTGLILWNQNRQQWIERKKPQLREPKLRTLSLCASRKCWLCVWDPNHKGMLKSNKLFRRPIPLAEMVDFLVDIWEEEGLFD